MIFKKKQKYGNVGSIRSVREDNNDNDRYNLCKSLVMEYNRHNNIVIWRDAYIRLTNALSNDCVLWTGRNARIRPTLPDESRVLGNRGEKKNKQFTKHTTILKQYRNVRELQIFVRSVFTVRLASEFRTKNRILIPTRANASSRRTTAFQ